jgi:hypothetical protein
VRAPAGAVVSIYVDLLATVSEGDYIITRSGRRYEVVSVRVQTRGKHVGRQHLKCEVLRDDDPMDNGTRTHRIVWYPRKKRNGSR